MSDPDASSPESQALYDQAHAALAAGDLEEAKRLGATLREQHFTGCYEIDALIAHAEGHPERGIEVLEQGTQRFPDLWLLWQLLGNFRSDAGELDEAERCYTQAAQAPGANQASVQLNLAVLSGRRGDHAKALARLSSIDPEDSGPDWWFSFANAWIWCKRELRAEKLEAGHVFALMIDSATDDEAYRCVQVAHVAARDETEAWRILMEDAGDWFPGGRLDSAEIAGSGEGHLTGVLRLARDAQTYPVEDEE